MSGFEEAHEQALQLGMVIVRKTLSRFAESCPAARNTQSGQSLLPQHQDSTAVTADFIQQRHALGLPQDYLKVRGHVKAYGARWPQMPVADTDDPADTLKSWIGI